VNLQIKAATLKFSIICSLVGLGKYLTAISVLLLGLYGREKQFPYGTACLSLFLSLSLSILFFSGVATV
jgi:hypothetical protein